MTYSRPYSAILAVLILFFSACSPAPKTSKSLPSKNKEGVLKTYDGIASWYGYPFHGRRTASGERYNMYDLTVAHKTLPFGTRLRLTNRESEKTIVVRVNDRGPFIKHRELDLSLKAAQLLDVQRKGFELLKIEILSDGFATMPDTAQTKKKSGLIKKTIPLVSTTKLLFPQRVLYSQKSDL